jgi:nucleoside phosphorylase
VLEFLPVPSPPWDPTQRPDVAVLIALPEEFRSLAGEYAKQWHSQRNPDHTGTDFLFVGPRGYRCVAAIMPCMGPTVASQTSMRLLARRPAVIINVGIAGGFKEDLCIGDVIVPRQVDAYDETGKIKDIRWERRGSDYRPSADLLIDVQELEFTAADAHASWVNDGAVQLAELRAGPAQDQIDALLANKLLRTAPIVSTNHLASGSFVVASKAFADFIREANVSIHAGEMEAAGMMTAAEYWREGVKTLVVRGISDHVDANKSELDAIGDGALRRLAMANAWRLVRTLMLLGLLPRSSGEEPPEELASPPKPVPLEHDILRGGLSDRDRREQQVAANSRRVEIVREIHATLTGAIGGFSDAFGMISGQNSAELEHRRRELMKVAIERLETARKTFVAGQPYLSASASTEIESVLRGLRLLLIDPEPIRAYVKLDEVAKQYSARVLPEIRSLLGLS